MTDSSENSKSGEKASKPAEEPPAQTGFEKARASYFQKTKNNDYVVYDSRCEIMKFNDRHTLQIEPEKFYQDLDLEEAKKNYAAGLVGDASLPGPGLNEVSYQLYDGNSVYRPGNVCLFQLCNPGKNPFDLVQGKAD